MKTYSIKCRKGTENSDPKVVRTKKSPVCGIKKSRFVKEKEAKSLLISLLIKRPLCKIPLLNVLF